MEKISVIIPVYNVDTFLCRCIESVIDNTYKNLEIICINDGSTDKSLQILNAFAKNDPRIIIINQENSGVSNSRNVGMRSATGEYIAFIDADDWVHPEYFEILLKGIKENNADIVICEYEKKPCYDLDTKEYTSYSDTKFTELEYSNLDTPHTLRSFVWGRLYKKSLFENRPFNEKISYMEDKDLALSLLCDYENLKIYTTAAPLYYYFVRRNSLSNSADILKTVTSLNYILNRADDYADFNSKAIYIDEALRYSLIVYNRAKSDKSSAKEDRKAAKNLIKNCVKKMKEVPVFSKKYKTIYGFFGKFPFLHGIFRSLVYKLRGKRK